MPKFEKVVDKQQFQPDYLFDCPGCGNSHGVWTSSPNHNGAKWNFNNDMNKPTVSPSIVVHGEKNNVICHSYISNGMIQFLVDCTHHLAGQTVELPEINQ